LLFLGVLTVKKAPARRLRRRPLTSIIDPHAEFLRTGPAALAIGVGRTRFWALRKSDPTFPKPVRLGERAITFRRSELLAWAEGRKE